jgi:hypothetical protein
MWLLSVAQSYTSTNNFIKEEKDKCNYHNVSTNAGTNGKYRCFWIFLMYIIDNSPQILSPPCIMELIRLNNTQKESEISHHLE